MAKEEYGVNGIATAANLMVVALLDKLVAKGALTQSEVHELLAGAQQTVSPFSKALSEQDAAAIIADVRRRFK
jgi:hypothetical protein